MGWDNTKTSEDGEFWGGIIAGIMALCVIIPAIITLFCIRINGYGLLSIFN